MKKTARIRYKSRISVEGMLKAVIALTTAIVIGAGVCCMGFASRSADGKWFGNFQDIASWHWKDKATKPEDKKDSTEDKKDPTEENNNYINSGENNGILLKSRRLAVAEFEDFGIDEQANMAYSITAAVNQDAADKSVRGSIAWKNSSSEWATGKSIYDYIEFSQATEGGLNFTLTVKQAFGEPVIIKVSSSMDSGVYGTAQVDYLKELKSFTATLNPTIPNNHFGRIYVGNSTMNTIQINPTYGVGTLTGTISNYETIFTTNSYFRTQLKTKLNAGNGTSGFSPVEKISVNGKDFKIPFQGSGSILNCNGLIVGGGAPPETIVNNFICAYGCTQSTGSAAATAGVVRIDYKITYSYGSDYTVIKTWYDQDKSETFGDNPTKTVYGFRNDNLTTVSTINNIQVSPDAIIVYPN